MRRIRKDDVVQVLSGKDKGKTGKVLRVFPAESACIVERVGLTKRHQKAKPGGGPSGIIEKNQKINWSKLALLDSKSEKTSRVRFSVVGGKKQRVFVKSGQAVGTA